MIQFLDVLEKLLVVPWMVPLRCDDRNNGSKMTGANAPYMKINYLAVFICFNHLANIGGRWFG